MEDTEVINMARKLLNLFSSSVNFYLGGGEGRGSGTGEGGGPGIPGFIKKDLSVAGEAWGEISRSP